MSSYTIKKLDGNQFDILIPLMENCFGMNVSLDYFKWKFLDNPAGKFIGFTAVENETNEVAAYYGVIPEKYIIGGGEKTIYQSGDTMTHSNHRRKGLFQKLAAHCYDYLRENEELFVIGFGGAQSAGGLVKLGWKKAFDFHTLFVPRLFCRTALLSKSAGECRIVTDLQILKNLIQEKPAAEIHSARTVEHAAWRYANPLHSYEILAAANNSSVEGYVCYYLDGGKIFLFDFVFTTKNSRKTLLGNLKKKVVKENLKGIVAFCPENGLPTAQLKQSGFLLNPFSRGPLNEKNPFMFYADEETMRRFSGADCWSIKSYDHDAL